MDLFDLIESKRESLRNLSEKTNLQFLTLSKIFGHQSGPRLPSLKRLLRVTASDFYESFYREYELERLQTLALRCFSSRKKKKPILFLGPIENFDFVFVVERIREYDQVFENLEIEFEERKKSIHVEKEVSHLLERARKIWPNFDIERAIVIGLYGCDTYCSDCPFSKKAFSYLKDKKKIFIVDSDEIEKGLDFLFSQIEEKSHFLSLFSSSSLSTSILIDLSSKELSSLSSLKTFKTYEVLSNLKPQRLQNLIFESVFNCSEFSKYQNRDYSCSCIEIFQSLKIRPSEIEDKIPFPFVFFSESDRSKRKELICDLRPLVGRSKSAQPVKRSQISQINYFSLFERLMISSIYELKKIELDEKKSFFSLVVCQPNADVHIASMKRPLLYRCTKNFLEARLFYLRPKKLYFDPTLFETRLKNLFESLFEIKKISKNKYLIKDLDATIELKKKKEIFQ